jgi:hypothetical protein
MRGRPDRRDSSDIFIYRHKGKIKNSMQCILLVSGPKLGSAQGIESVYYPSGGIVRTHEHNAVGHGRRREIMVPAIGVDHSSFPLMHLR